MINNLIYLFVMGLVFGSGPCLASCGPLMLSYALGRRSGLSGSLLFYALFSLARIACYLALGLLLFFLGRVVLEDYFAQASSYVYFFGGAFVVLVGILLAFGEKFRFWPCGVLRKELIDHDAKTILIFGIIAGIIPCAPLLALFSYVTLVSKSWLQNLVYCLAFGLGTVFSPLILFALAPGFIKGRQNIFRIAGGLGLAIVGVILMMKGA